MNQSVFITN